MWAEWRTYMVEASFAFFFLGRHMSVPLFQEYVRTELSRPYEDKHKAINASIPVVLNELESKEIQRQSAITVLALQVVEGLPAIIGVIVMGAVSDRTGRRKMLLWVPNLGLLAYSFVYVMTIYTGWDLNGLFLASALRGLSGSIPAFQTGSTFYAVNSASEEHKTFRLATQEFINGVTFAIGNLIVGYWVTQSGYAAPFWFVFGCSVISLLIVTFGVQELNLIEPTPASEDPNCFKSIFNPMLKFFRVGDVSITKIWLAILAFQAFSFIQLGQESTTVLYLLGSPLSWTSSAIGLYLAIMMGCSAAGTIFGVHIMSDFLRDSTIALVGYFSKAIGSLWLGVVKEDFLVYASTLLFVLQLVPNPMLRSMVARQADSNDHGSLFALMHCGQSVTFFLGPLVFAAIYSASVHVYPGMVFVSAMLLMVIPTILTLAIRILDKRKTDTVYHPVADNIELMSNQTSPPQRLDHSSSQPDVQAIMVTA